MHYTNGILLCMIMLGVYHCIEGSFLEVVWQYCEKKLISCRVSCIHFVLISYRFRLPLLSSLQEVCKFLKDPSLSDKLLLENVFQAVNLYYNYSGEASCLDMSETATKNLGQLGWYYQVCALSFLNCNLVRFFELMRIVRSFSHIAPDVTDVPMTNVIMKWLWL